MKTQPPTPSWGGMLNEARMYMERAPLMAIAPGLFETAMSAGLPPEVRTALEAGLPFPSRMGRPEEYAMLVQHIVENPLLNGEVIRLDSAVRLAPK